METIVYQDGAHQRAIYFTDRNLPLAYHGHSHDVPVVALECYCKWYSIYVVRPDGTVVCAHDEYSDELYEVYDAVKGVPYVDHVFNPDVLHVFAKRIGGHICSESLELCIGRWEREVRENYIHNLEYDV